MVGPASQSAQRAAPDDPTPAPLPDAPSATGSARAARWAKRIAIGAVGLAGLGLVAITVATFVERRMYSDRVLPGVAVDGASSSGRHEVTVYDSVARLGAKLARSPVRVRIGHRELSAAPSLLDLTVDARATARAAKAHGRNGSLAGQLFGTALRWVRPDHVPLKVAYDENRLEGLLDGWSAETDDRAVEGGLRFRGSQVVPIQPHAGTGILRTRARAALKRMLSSAQRPVLELPVGTIHPRVDAASVDAAATRARRLLANRLAITIGPTTIRVTPRQLAKALGTRVVGHDLRVTLEAARLHSVLGKQLERLEASPVDAGFEITTDNTVRVVPSRDGLQIDMSAVVGSIMHDHRHIVAPLRAVTPRHDTKWARALGIAREVSSFTTDYPPDQTRVVNIHRGADLLNNTVVEPGRTFSLNDTIGPRTKERGFVTAPVFAEGEFFDDYGGGVSQLATTTYNAAFFAGYADVTHQPHTIYISRYPPGREATVNYGVIDLKFRNDTPHGILIRTYYGPTSISVALYGDTEGRTAHEENRTISNPVAVANQTFLCPAAKTVDPHDLCATLPAGQTEQISTGDPGLDVAFDRVIEQPGKPGRREHYTWHYTMLPNQILVGSVPTATPTATSTPTSTAAPTEPSGPTTTRPDSATTPATRANGPP